MAIQQKSLAGKSQRYQAILYLLALHLAAWK